MCCSCWRHCCCGILQPKTDHEDPPAREVQRHLSNKNVRATTRSHNKIRRSDTGDMNSGEKEERPVSPPSSLHRAQAAPIPPIINWIMARQPRTRKNSTSRTASSGRRSVPRGITDGRGLQTRRRSPYMGDTVSTSLLADDTSVGEALCSSGKSPQRRAISRFEQTPLQPPELTLAGDPPSEFQVSRSHKALPDSTLGGGSSTRQLPLEVSRSTEAVSNSPHLDTFGREQYANDLPEQLGQESPKIVSSDSLLPSTAPGQLLMQGGTPADDIGFMTLPTDGGEMVDAARPQNMDKDGEKDVSHKKPASRQRKQFSPQTSPKEAGPARSSITDDHTKPKRRGTLPLSRALVRFSSRKGPSTGDTLHASPPSWDASDDEQLDSGQHGRQKSRNRHTSQQHLDQGSKYSHQAGVAVPQLVASNTSTPGKDRYPHQATPRGLARGNVSSEKRTDPARRVIDSRKSSSQGPPSTPRVVPGAIASKEDTPTHQSRAKPLTMQKGLFSSNGSHGKSHRRGPVTATEDRRQQALVASRELTFKAGPSAPGSVPSIVPRSKPKPRVNTTKNIIPANLPAQTPLTVFSSTSGLRSQQNIHEAIVASKPKARSTPSRTAQPPASTVRRQKISLPRSNLVEIPGPALRREYYLLDENPDNWLTPSMELYEIADFVYGYLTEYISSMDLSDFYPRGSSYLHELSAKAAVMVKRGTGRAIEEIADYPVDHVAEGVAKGPTGDGTGDAGGDAAGDSTTALNTPNDIIDMVKIALYDVVIYCDDSGSMNAEGGGRIEALKELARRVAKITSTFDTAGIKVRFINFVDDDGFNNLRTVDEVQRVLNTVNFNGGTKIGTGLEHKVLNPLLFDKLRAGTLKRPLLVTTITDGSPYGEDESHFKNMIVKCKETLRKEGFQPTSVVFQVSQVGSATDGEHFINILHNDSQVGEMVYCTAEKLDDKIAELKDNEVHLERWLLDLLLQGL